MPDRLRKSRLDFPVVGLGASAGGVQALQRFFGAMPAANGMAFVVVVHLAPDQPSHIAEVLQHKTTMPVLQVDQTTPIEPGRVYVIPPSCDLVMDDGLLRLAEPSRDAGAHLPVDLFFRTLAEVHGEQAVGVVLSGTGEDGSAGIAHIREAGGITFAQSPADCGYDGMPTAAIASQSIDFVMPAAAMPERLLQLIPQGRPDSADESRMQALQDILRRLRSVTSHDFQHYKKATVLRRIGRRMQLHGLPDLAAYATFLEENIEECALLLQDMLISVTSFFRDREAFAAIDRLAITDIIKNRAPDIPVRAWVVGCATGEEAYSIAMLLHEASEKAGAQLQLPSSQVFASDIDDRALAAARSGIYAKSVEADIPPGFVERYLHRQNDRLRASTSLRQTMLFASHNVLRDPPFSRIDLICCRNLLIYLSRAAQMNILEIFHFALNPGGYLFLGASESADMLPALFTVVDKKHRIYCKKAQPHKYALRHLSSGAALPTHPSMMQNPATPTNRIQMRNSMAELHARALENVSAQSVLIDEDYDILYLSGGAGRYMEPAGGVPTTDLLPNVRPALRIELRTALFQLSQTGQKVTTPAVRVEHRDGQCQVRMTLHPITPEEGARRLILVLFEDVDASGAESPAGLADDRLLVTRYEDEVERLKAHLRHTVEQADISTEDLKASNEELQSINEELRSLTEELETSKEELQSMNEELSTVNSELKNKVDETDKVNDDLQNFIMASEIASLFVGRDLHIKRFTPQAASIFNVIASDIDRPLLDITNQLDYPELADDLRDVIEKLKVVERPISGSQGRHYLARLRPYRTTDNKIAGAMLTFVDVSELRAARQAVLGLDGQAPK